MSIQVIAWKSSAIKRVAKSTFAAELLNLTNVYDQAGWLRDLVKEVLGGNLELHLRSDCIDVTSHVESQRLHPREKRIAKEVAVLREGLSTKDITSIQHVSSRDMNKSGS